MAVTVAEGLETVRELIAVLQTLPSESSVTNMNLEYVDVIVTEEEDGEVSVEIA